MGGGALRRKGNHPHETGVFVPKSSALLGNVEAHAGAVQGSRSAGLDRVPIPRRARWGAERQGKRSLQARTPNERGQRRAPLAFGLPPAISKKDCHHSRRRKEMTQCAVRTGLGARAGAGWQWTRDGETMAGTAAAARNGRTKNIQCVSCARRATLAASGRRVAVLCGGGIFVCRYCYQLAYASSREDAGGRATGGLIGFG